MKQMGATNTIYETRESCIIQMGTNAGSLNKDQFKPATQLGANDISTPQMTYENVQQQQPKRHNEEECIRQQQMQQIQL